MMRTPNPKSKKRFFLVCLAALFLSGAFLILNKSINYKNIPKIYNHGTYPDEFASGKRILSYNSFGIYSYDGKLKKRTELVSFTNKIYGNPVLSPDNNKIVYYVATSQKEDASYDLWIYDIKQKKQKKLLNNVYLRPGYIQNPFWTKDSQSLVINYLQKDKFRLFKIELGGRIKELAMNYSGSIFYNILNENYFGFATNSDCSVEYPCNDEHKYDEGIIDIKKNKAFFISIYPNYLLPIRSGINAGLILNVHKDIGRLDIQKVDFSDQKIKNLSSPLTVKLKNHAQVSVIRSCGDFLLVGEMAPNDPLKSGDLHYQNYYVFNLKSNTLREFNDSAVIPDSNYPFECGIDYKNSKAYSHDYFHRNKLKPIDINEINLENPSEIKELNYFDLFPKEMKIQLTKPCLFAEFIAADNKNGNDYAYISIDSEFTHCNGLDTSYSGTYRLSLSEQSVTKIGPQRQQGFLLLPNL